MHASSSGFLLAFLSVTKHLRAVRDEENSLVNPGEPIPFDNKSIQNLSKVDWDKFDETLDQLELGSQDNLYPFHGYTDWTEPEIWGRPETKFVYPYPLFRYKSFSNLSISKIHDFQ